MGKWKTLQLLIVSLAAAVSAAPQPPKTIHTTSGAVYTENCDATGLCAFKGVPYAAPPVGDSRWRPPASPNPWNKPLNTTSYGSSCYVFAGSGPIPPPPTPQSEDCLYLNIWTASPNASSKLPVMVWVHGGGFQSDSATSPRYDGTHLAQSGVVVVSFDYRLGNFGFFAHPDLDKEGSNSGNFGLLDQILALDWVKANIKAFGGDPNNLTIFGESSGAHAIGLLMSSPLAHGRFHKAIIESGAWWESEHGSLLSFDEARQKGITWAQKFGPSPSLAQLRKLSAQSVVGNSTWNFDTDPIITGFTPTLDKYVLPSLPSKVFSSGLQSRVPLLAGWNLDEGLLFQSRSLPKSSPEEFREHLSAFFDVPGRNSTQDEEQLEILYPSHTENETIASANKLIGDLIISEQTWEAAYLHSQLGVATFVYHFTYASPFSPVPQHTADIPFVFGNLFGPPGSAPASASDRAFSDRVVKYWVNFATSGNPNTPGSVQTTWPQFSHQGGSEPSILTLGTTIEPDSDYDFGAFQFLRSFRVNGALPLQWRSQ